MLASSVQRSKPTPYPSKARSALIRRTIVVALVLVALKIALGPFVLERGLQAEYDDQQRGFELREVAGGWRLYSRPEFAAFVERFVLDDGWFGSRRDDRAA